MQTFEVVALIALFATGAFAICYQVAELIQTYRRYHRAKTMKYEIKENAKLRRFVEHNTKNSKIADRIIADLEAKARIDRNTRVYIWVDAEDSQWGRDFLVNTMPEDFE